MRFRNGSLLLFRLFGVDVFVHWSWLLIAIFQINARRQDADLLGHHHGIGFEIAVYLSLFAIVVVHEFGHALACKSVGGIAKEIVLWPLGGLAFVNPPPRPGPTLWSIAAGPLVNVVLLPFTIIPALLVNFHGNGAGSLLGDYLATIAYINAGLLIFNILPLFPLDGGQILRSLLWFLVGRGTSLIIAGWIGVVGAAGMALLGIFMGGGIFTIVVALFLGLSALSATRAGAVILRTESLPRHADAHCPACGECPTAGPMWRCKCGATFDTFDTRGRCPRCGAAFEHTACPFCGQSTPQAHWFPPLRDAQPSSPMV